jgi:hypothetical protein
MKPIALSILNSTLLIVFATTIHTAASAQATERLVMTSPLEGAVLPMQNQILIEAQFEPPVDFLTTSIQARVEARRGSEHIVIAEGDIRSIESPDRLRARWDIAGLKPGHFVISVSATAGERTGIATANVTLHQVPRVYVRKVSVEKRGDGAKVTFLASAHSSAGTPIDEFIWTPGDGDAPTRTKTGTFSHFYSRLGATYVLWLEVNDVLGGSALVARDLILGGVFNSELKETHDCGCKDMTVRVPNPNVDVPTMSGTYCALNKNEIPANIGCAALNAPPEGTCPTSAVAYQCPLGSILSTEEKKKLGWTFEVVANLEALTNDSNEKTSQCTQGQYLSMTREVDGHVIGNGSAEARPPDGQVNLPGFSFVAVGRPAPVPPFKLRPVIGPYGADDYTSPSSYKSHDAGDFRWIDSPKFQFDDPMKQASSMTQEAEFITFVNGDLGSCWCDFSIRESWTNTAGFTGGLHLIQGHDCSVSGPTQLDERVLFMPHRGAIVSRGTLAGGATRGSAPRK